MKLKWSGGAVLAVFACAAHAQSSVTLYGAIDSGLVYQSTVAASFAPNAKNLGHVFGYKDAGIYSSFWGLKGTEDIGGGYKVNFRVQGVFNSGTGKLGLADTTGGTAVFNQQTTVGISGPFGTFDAGRQFTPMIYAMADTDVRNAQYFGSILSAWLGVNQAAGWPGTNSNVPIGALYDSNALVYQSPKFYGASLGLEYAPGGVP
uniref:porin n=1 Tax=Burkholderia guangdongensis TaxID=1792500 RepID=UPI0015CD842E